jgi:5,10-methylenetetrahydrofolate reductase
VNSSLTAVLLGSDWFITQGIFAVEPIINMILAYGDTCKQLDITPKKVILTFAPCGREKTMQFIKWLGMFVPPEVEARIFGAANPVEESVKVRRLHSIFDCAVVTFSV